MNRLMLFGLAITGLSLLVILLCSGLLLSSKRRFARQREKLLEDIEQGGEVQ